MASKNTLAPDDPTQQTSSDSTELNFSPQGFPAQ